MEDVEKLVHIENARGLHDNAVNVLHTEGDELSLETASVAVRIAAACYHFQLTAVAFQLLQYHHIYIDSAEVVFENGYFLTAVNEVAGVLQQESGLSRAQYARYKIYFCHGSRLL